MGTLPATGLLLTSYGVVHGHYQSMSDVAYALGVSVSDDGWITFLGERRGPQYIMKHQDQFNGFETKHDVVKDWARCYMYKHLGSKYHVYRYLV